MAKSDSDKKKIREALDAIKRRAGASGEVDELLFVEASNLAQLISPDKDEVVPQDAYRAIEERIAQLLQFGRLKSKIERAEKIAAKILPEATTEARMVRGALSNEKIWGILGWRLTPHGFVWSRPPSMRFKESFPPTGVTGYRATYDADGTPIDDSEFYPPVTAFQGRQFQKEDRERERKERERQREEERRRRERELEEKRRRKEHTRRVVETAAERASAYRKFPWVKSLVDAGMIQKKELPKITRLLMRASKAPIVGGFVRHPSLMPIAAYGAAVSLLNKADTSNKGYVGWENAFNYFGKPSKNFISNAMLAGIEDPAKIAEVYGKLKLKYLDPEKFLKTIGGRMAGMDETQRLFVANSLGLSPEVLAMADLMSGRMRPSEARYAVKGKALADIKGTAGWRTGSGLMDSLEALFLMIPGVKSLRARDYASGTKGYKERLEGDAFEEVFEDRSSKRSFQRPEWAHPFGIEPDALPDFLKPERWINAKEAAVSAEDYDSGKVGSNSKGAGMAPTGTQIAFNINELRVDADNYQELIQSVTSEAGMRYNIDVINWADSRRMKA